MRYAEHEFHARSAPTLAEYQLIYDIVKVILKLLLEEMMSIASTRIE